MKKPMRELLLTVEGLELQVQYKAVKNMTLRLKPDGRIFVSVPMGLSQAAVKNFVLQHLDWLQRKLAAQQREAAFDMAQAPFDGRHVWLWGQRRELAFIVDRSRAGAVEVLPQRVLLYVARMPQESAKEAWVEALYKQQVQEQGLQLLDYWQQQMGLHYTALKLRHMKTRWGTCNVRTGVITLNSLLACWPRECLEYIVVHELAHLRIHGHGPLFHQLVGSYLPQWQQCKQLLKSFKPVN